MNNTYLSADSISPGKGNRTTGAQRYNARMDKIWASCMEAQARETARRNSIKIQTPTGSYSIKEAA